MPQIKTCTGILTPALIQQTKVLLKDLKFNIAYDKDISYLNDNTKLQGLSRITTIEPIDNLDEKLNIFGLFITEKVCEKAQIKYKTIKRFLWNIYRQNEEGQFHQDADENHVSIVYSFNKTDGYLQINDAKFYDVEDEAKIFSSNLQHKGVCPTKELLRINLNILLEI